MLAEGDRVVTRLTVRGTHQGDFQGIPPTGKPVTVSGINIDRIANGKIQESWAQFDPDRPGMVALDSADCLRSQ